MTPEPVDLDGTFWDIKSLSDDEAEAAGEAAFHDEFITRDGRSGEIKAHDGESVLFFADRYHHAFHTSPDRARRAYSKGKVARDRIARIRWIRPIVEGRIPGTECWEVPLKIPEEGLRPFPGKRLYVLWPEEYVIWLIPLKNGGFKFSTAYLIPPGEIGSYLKLATKIWSYGGE